MIINVQTSARSAPYRLSFLKLMFIQRYAFAFKSESHLLVAFC